MTMEKHENYIKQKFSDVVQEVTMDCDSKQNGANEPQITALLGGNVKPVVKEGV